MRGYDYAIGVFAIISFVSLVGIFFSAGNLVTGFASTQTSVSQVTIQKFFSISSSGNLSEGINFGDVSELPAFDLNGSANYIGASDGSEYYISVSEDSNTAVDFCIKADGNLTSAGLDEIDLDNEKWHSSNSTDVNSPALGSASSLTTSYVAAETDIAVGNDIYFRFWLDIPAATPTGTYNNTIEFKGVSTGVGC